MSDLHLALLLWKEGGHKSAWKKDASIQNVLQYINHFASAVILVF